MSERFLNKKRSSFLDSVRSLSSRGFTQEGEDWLVKKELSYQGTLQGPKVTIIGSGWLARGLSNVMRESEIPCILGSRDFEKALATDFDFAVSLAHVEAAIEWGDIIILAIPHYAFKDLAHTLDDLGKGKIIVDPSNHEPSWFKSSTVDKSVAEDLQALLPASHVIKAFNTISAYTLTNNSLFTLGTVLPYCGDSQEAKETFSGLLRHMGLTPRDKGPLQRAVLLERIPYEFLSQWRKACLVMAACFVFLYTWQYEWYCVLTYPKFHGPVYQSHAAFMTIMNKVFPSLAIALFSATYLAGSVAAIYQLATNSASKRFPVWLDSWLSIRKHLGLLGLWISFQHAIFACLQMSNQFYSNLYDAKDSNRLNKWGESSMLLGVWTLAIFSVLGTTSIPSVAASLSWREWNFIQTWLGYIGLAMGTAHGVLYLITFDCSDYGTACTIFPAIDIQAQIDVWPGKIPPASWIAMGAPGLTLALKLILMLPPISWQLNHLRGGGKMDNFFYCGKRNDEEV